MARPGTLERAISPPLLRRASTAIAQTALPERSDEEATKASAAAIEAGEIDIRDHLTYFVNHLSAACKPHFGPRISIHDFEDLYRRNQHAHGRHFVVHQHDHPISGVHYDLRLQFSETSSISFAVPYGLPGNPNSLRPNRMAIETRVHNLWNHLIESASHHTGSLLIWDTGKYEVLPRKQKERQQITDDEISDLESNVHDTIPENEKLVKAFQSRHIRLRLHGHRLPRNYTIALRLPTANDRSTQPRRPQRKRQRIDPQKSPEKLTHESDHDSDTVSQDGNKQPENELAAAIASEDEEDVTIRTTNAYIGASNTIGSVYQRHWFLTIDRQYSGLRKARSGPEAGRWCGTWEAFYVRGREYERSVITGRLADDVMADEGVEKFVGRKMWRPITE